MGRTFPVKYSKSGAHPLYIVGTGASVLDFDFDAFSDETTTVALNDAIFLSDNFMFHSFEPSRNEAWRPVIEARIRESLLRGKLEVLSNISRHHLLKEKPVFFHEFPERVNLWSSTTASKAVFPMQLDWYLSSSTGIYTPGPDPNFSLGRLLVRAIKLGYRDIRLVGIDLVTPEHFWHFSDEFRWIRQQHSLFADYTRLGEHKINSKKREWPALQFIQQLQDLTSSQKVEIRVFSSSPLSEHFRSWDK